MFFDKRFQPLIGRPGHGPVSARRTGWGEPDLAGVKAPTMIGIAESPGEFDEGAFVGD
ncbi:hypothetical protein [Cutibacterium sp.]|uniref:hypothetical protein n=1 Tax=Cutibacterium sp. TaxID=1912221 RepID=UPI0026DAC27E|nr:hypothetical protein [Cutibacterium sp.]MDO4412294.1 hypothetical protein [Cutibacterium sp.]